MRADASAKRRNFLAGITNDDNQTYWRNPMKQHVMRAANFKQTATDAADASARALTANHATLVASATLAGAVPPPPDLNAAIRAARQQDEPEYTVPTPDRPLAANGVPQPADLNESIRAASKVEDFKARVRAFLRGGR